MIACEEDNIRFLSQREDNLTWWKSEPFLVRQQKLESLETFSVTFQRNRSSMAKLRPDFRNVCILSVFCVSVFCTQMSASFPLHWAIKHKVKECVNNVSPWKDLHYFMRQVLQPMNEQSCQRPRARTVWEATISLPFGNLYRCSASKMIENDF